MIVNSLRRQRGSSHYSGQTTGSRAALLFHTGLQPASSLLHVAARTHRRQGSNGDVLLDQDAPVSRPELASVARTSTEQGPESALMSLVDTAPHRRRISRYSSRRAQPCRSAAVLEESYSQKRPC